MTTLEELVAKLYYARKHHEQVQDVIDAFHKEHYTYSASWDTQENHDAWCSMRMHGIKTGNLAGSLLTQVLREGRELCKENATCVSIVFVGDKGKISINSDPLGLFKKEEVSE